PRDMDQHQECTDRDDEQPDADRRAPAVPGHRLARVSPGNDVRCFGVASVDVVDLVAAHVGLLLGHPAPLGQSVFSCCLAQVACRSRHISTGPQPSSTTRRTSSLTKASSALINATRYSASTTNSGGNFFCCASGAGKSCAPVTARMSCCTNSASWPSI